VSSRSPPGMPVRTVVQTGPETPLNHSARRYLLPLRRSRSVQRLEPVLEDWSERFSGPFLYFAGRQHLPPPLRAFVDFLKSPSACRF